MAKKKAIIIGGSKGLGAEISKEIKKLGIKTVSCSRKEIDTSDLNSVNNFANKHKSTDILVLNSGGPPPLSFDQISINDWQKYFNQLFLSYFILLQKIKINKDGYVFYISSAIIKEPGDGIIISSSLRPAMSSLLKSIPSYLCDQDGNNLNDIKVLDSSMLKNYQWHESDNIGLGKSFSTDADNLGKPIIYKDEIAHLYFYFK